MLGGLRRLLVWWARSSAKLNSVPRSPHEARRRREEPVTAVAAFCYSTQILGAKVGTRHVHYRTTVRLFLHNTIAYGFRVLVSNTNPLNRATHHTGQAERT